MSRCTRPIAKPQSLAINLGSKSERESFKSDQWDFANNPELLGLLMTYELKALLRQGDVTETHGLKHIGPLLKIAIMPVGKMVNSLHLKV